MNMFNRDISRKYPFSRKGFPIEISYVNTQRFWGVCSKAVFCQKITDFCQITDFVKKSQVFGLQITDFSYKSQILVQK